MALELTTANDVSTLLTGGTSIASAVEPYCYAAEAVISGYCNRETTGDTEVWSRTEHIQYFDGLRHDSVVLTFVAISAVTSVSIVQSAGEGAASEVVEEIDLTTLTVDGVAIPDLAGANQIKGVLRFRSSEWGAWGDWGSAVSPVPAPNFGGGNFRLKVVYTGGYQTMPPDLVAAAGMLAAHLYRQATTDTTMQSKRLGEYSWTRASAADAKSAIPADVQVLLARHRRPPSV